MWFKNLQLFRLRADWNTSLEALNEQLARGAFAKCASNQPMSRGWVSPRKDGSLIERMESDGVVSAMNASGARTVLANRANNA